jgi:hypothetical protein
MAMSGHVLLMGVLGRVVGTDRCQTYFILVPIICNITPNLHEDKVEHMFSQMVLCSYKISLWILMHFMSAPDIWASVDFVSFLSLAQRCPLLNNLTFKFFVFSEQT